MSNKTVIDAVNKFECEWPKFEGDYSLSIAVCTKESPGFDVGEIYDVVDGCDWNCFKAICTIEEFNQCVAEMSEGLFVPDCRPKTPEIKYDKDGNGFEVGALYEFSNVGGYWLTDIFARCDGGGGFRDANGYQWDLIRECQAPLGKVHKKPVELKNGQIYMFDMGVTTLEVIGRYYVAVTGEKMFDLVGNNRFVKVSDCKNITRLVPEAK